MAKQKIVERMNVKENNLYYREHLSRYQFAAQHITNGPTLDIAAGTGYGANILLETSQSLVVGVDLHLPSLIEAHHQFTDHRLVFLSADGTVLPFLDRSFVNIVTLETIEHIQNDRAFLSELSRLQTLDGTCILSTPIRTYSIERHIKNPYHVREYIESELRALLVDYFEQVSIYFQGYSISYHQEFETYSSTIQTKKQNLNPLLRFGINYVYKPLKNLIPSGITNLFIRRLLRLSIPQPDTSEIVIAREGVVDPSVMVVVCRKPINHGSNLAHVQADRSKS